MTNRHMPFANRNRAGIQLALCTCDDMRTWNVHVERDGTLNRVQTGLVAGCVECSPTFYEQGETIMFSYVGGGHATLREHRPYALYRRAFDSSLNPVGEPVLIAHTAAGFVAPWGQAVTRYSGPHVAQIEVAVGRDNVLTLEADAKIYRVSYHPDDDDQILISGGNQDGEFAVRYRLDSGEQVAVFDGNTPVYKAAELGGELWYAKRVGKGFEDREIVKAKNIKTRKVRIFFQV